MIKGQQTFEKDGKDEEEKTNLEEEKILKSLLSAAFGMGSKRVTQLSN